MADNLTLDGADDGYSKDKFFCGASDKAGHSRFVRVRIPPHMEGAIAEAVGKCAAYKSVCDIARDALVHRLHDLGEKDGALSGSPQLRAFIAHELMDSYKADIALYSTLQARIKETAKLAIAHGDFFRLKDIFDKVAVEVDGVPEPFASKLRMQIKGFLLRAKTAKKEKAEEAKCQL